MFLFERNSLLFDKGFGEIDNDSLRVLAMFLFVVIFVFVLMLVMMFLDISLMNDLLRVLTLYVFFYFGF